MFLVGKESWDYMRKLDDEDLGDGLESHEYSTE